MEKLLRQFNFSDSEILVFQSLLKSGGATVSEIAKRAKIKRTSCQEVIRSLEEKGFMIASQRGNILFYQTEDPDKFSQIVNERQFVVDQLIHQLSQKEKRNKWSVRSITKETAGQIIKREKRRKNISDSFEQVEASIYCVGGDKLVLLSTNKENPAIEILSPELVVFHQDLLKNSR